MASKTIEPVLATDNVVILEVDNLLSGWPTYIVDFTPKKTGPVVSQYLVARCISTHHIHTENSSLPQGLSSIPTRPRGFR